MCASRLKVSASYVSFRYEVLEAYISPLFLTDGWCSTAAEDLKRPTADYEYPRSNATATVTTISRSRTRPSAANKTLSIPPSFALLIMIMAITSLYAL